MIPRKTPAIPRPRLWAAIRHLAAGGVLAYPTEAVFGLGCDPDNPDAIQTLLKLKDRSPEKGLILIAAEFQQLLPYIDLSAVRDWNKILKTWPGPITWLIKARPTVPFRLRGNHESIAVRVTAHPLASSLCRAFGKPLVSTSANPGGAPPAKSALKTRIYFGSTNILIVRGALGLEPKPTPIFDARSFVRLR
ncbi:MAG: Sua5/YciO/YrdC/YwlC family protein [Gammaproteobacteria bacterium]